MLDLATKDAILNDIAKTIATKPTINNILADRAKTHGEYSVHAQITQRLKAVMRDYPNWVELSDVQKESLEMMAHKIGRILAGDPNVRDHWDDSAGYSILAADRCLKP